MRTELLRTPVIQGRAIEADGPPVGKPYADERPGQAGFPGRRRPNQAHAVSGLQLERDILDDEPGHARGRHAERFHGKLRVWRRQYIGRRARVTGLQDLHEATVGLPRGDQAPPICNGRLDGGEGPSADDR